MFATLCEYLMYLVIRFYPLVNTSFVFYTLNIEARVIQIEQRSEMFEFGPWQRLNKPIGGYILCWQVVLRLRKIGFTARFSDDING